MSQATDYREIVAHYEACLAEHGDNHRGVDWPNAADAARRYEVMLGVVRPSDPRPVRVLDFGCGAGHLLEYVRASGRTDVAYTGLDISPAFAELCRRKFPGTDFYCTDVLRHDGVMPPTDYCLMNGVFTEKRSLSFDAMFHYMQRVLTHVFPACRYGLAFNVMSKHVDWERADLFHLPYDLLAGFLKREISRHFAFRADYGLYEYTVYVYRG
jgi:SAM-dependent methyltransferase